MRCATGSRRRHGDAAPRHPPSHLIDPKRTAAVRAETDDTFQFTLTFAAAASRR
jgi:hypothetical protein